MGSWLDGWFCSLCTVVQDILQILLGYIPTNRQIQTSEQNQPANHPLIQHRKTYPLLSKLPGALVLSVSQKFNDTALIGGKTGDLADDVTDEGSAAGRTALGAADTGLGGVKRGGGLFPLASKFNQEFQHMNRIQVIANPVGRSR